MPIVGGPLKGIKLRVSPLIQGVYFFKPYEPDKQFALSKFLRNNSIFFDIGANVGMHSLYALKSFPGVKIVAFEPFPKNVSYLKEVISRNKIINIDLIPCAVGNSTGKIYFEEGATNLQGKISNEKSNIEVSIISLDYYISQSNLVPDLIKVDVEGAEIEVLKGSKQLLSKHSPIWVIELHNQEQCKLVSEFFADKNYKLLRIVGDNDLFSLIDIPKPLSFWPDPEGVHGNIVAIPIIKPR